MKIIIAFSCIFLNMSYNTKLTQCSLYSQHINILLLLVIINFTKHIDRHIVDDL